MRVGDIRIVASVAVLVGGAGCAPHSPEAGGKGASAAGSLARRSTGTGRPPLDVIVRQGDARGAVAVAVTTAGIAPGHGALAGVALAALVQERLAARGVDATAVGGWDGWRLRALVGSPADAARVASGIRIALLTPVAQDEPAVSVVARKASALAQRPLPDAAWEDVAQCTGEAYAAGEPIAVGAAELETWRRAAHGLGRVAIAAVGDAALADAAAEALARGAPWPRAETVPPSTWPPPRAAAAVYRAAGEVPPGAARIVVTARTAQPERAVAAAPSLADPAGPLASRLAALEAPGRVRSVVATAHADGGCVATTIDLSARDLVSDGPARVATTAALAREELAVEIADGSAPRELGRVLTQRAADPRDAAERAAWWSLAGVRLDVKDDEPRMALAVGLAMGRDGPSATSDADEVRAEIDRASLAWRTRVVEARTQVEHGQGETWILLASPCGTASESSADAGSGAVVALAAAMQAADQARDAQVEPFVAPDGIGVLVHGPARSGESPQAHARRLADSAARAFAADEITPARFTQARTALIMHAAETDARALGGLADALSPGHPSWLDGQGTLFGLASISDESASLRAAAVRAGPLRLAVIANVDKAQAEAVVGGVDRWIARRPGQIRICAGAAAASSPRPGTYALDLPAGGLSEVIVGAPIGTDAPMAHAAATWLAASLDGRDGILAHALGGSATTTQPLARAWNAVVLGSSSSTALVLRVMAPDAVIDGAVAQVRSLLDRLRQGALRDDDRARASEALSRARLAASLDPRARLMDLWKGELPSPAPSLDDLRAFAAATLRNEALVIVAARPARASPDKATR